MSPSCNCSTKRLVQAATVPSAGPGRGRSIAGLFSPILPVVILALVPKCPACLAAYVAIGTGVGLSIAVATQVRQALVLLCVVMLLATSARLAWKFKRHRTG